MNIDCFNQQIKYKHEADGRMKEKKKCKNEEIQRVYFLFLKVF